MTITPISGTDDYTWIDGGGVRQSGIVVKAINGGSIDSTGAVVASTVSMLDTTNSSTTNLANGAAFTGTGVDVSRYATVVVSIYTSHVSATNGLSFQWSVDNVNWRVSDTFTIPATTLKSFAVQVQARYFRIVYTNGGTLTTTLELTTLLKSGTNPVSSQRPGFGRSVENDMQEVIAYGAVHNGTAFDLVTKPSLTSKIVSAAASVNLTAPRTAATDLFNIDGYCAAAAARFIHLYNKATAVTVGTDVPTRTMRLPPTAQFSFSFNPPLYFPAGFAYSLTVNAADTDATALTAADVVAMNVDYAPAT
jgi:hypothetical protein